MLAPDWSQSNNPPQLDYMLQGVKDQAAGHTSGQVMCDVIRCGAAPEFMSSVRPGQALLVASRREASGYALYLVPPTHVQTYTFVR